jgi:Ca-activated chloride channel family protein
VLKFDPGIEGVIGGALLLLIVGAMAYGKRAASEEKPALLYSSIHSFANSPKSGRVRFAFLPSLLKYFAIGSLIVAFFNPYIEVVNTSRHLQKPMEGSGLYLLVDQSGSMASPVETPLGKIPKIEYLKQLTTQFVKGVPEMLLGLVAFARTAHVWVPLTWDHVAVIDALNKIQVVQSRDEEGTAMGYAIFKTAHVIAATRYYGEETTEKRAPEYTLKNVAILLVTDGFPDPNPADQDNPLRMIGLNEAAQYAKEKNIRVYIVIIDPMLSTAEVAPQRHLLKRITELTEGKFYLIDSSMDLQGIFADVRTLEKNFLPNQTGAGAYQPLFLEYPFIALGLVLLCLALLLQGTLFRQTP